MRTKSGQGDFKRRLRKDDTVKDDNGEINKWIIPSIFLFVVNPSLSHSSGLLDTSHTERDRKGCSSEGHFVQ